MESFWRIRTSLPKYRITKSRGRERTVGFLGRSRNGTIMIVLVHDHSILYVLSFILLSLERCVCIPRYRRIDVIRRHVVGTSWDLLHLNDEPD
jgi:hypothetical protein